MREVKDLTGQRFGRWVVLERAPSGKRNRTMWKCRCDCGVISTVGAANLVAGRSNSCGCWARELASERELIDLTGRKFGTMKVINRAGYDKTGHPTWLCICDCGEIAIITGTNLKKTKACKRCGQKHQIEVATKHGMFGTRLYKLWISIKRRCYCTTAREYPDYGGRGIKMCVGWYDSPVKFRDWALANGYRDDLTIERIDVNGHYTPSNCTWIPKADQAKNKRNTHYVEYGGKTWRLKDLCDFLKIPFGVVRTRIFCHGWSIDDAISVPKGVRNNTYHRGVNNE